MKSYYTLYRNRLKNEHCIEKLRSNYRSELQSCKVNEQIEKKDIIFKPFISYSEKQNGVSEQIRRMMIDMTRATILERSINNDFYLKLVLTITYIKNSYPTKVLQKLNSYEALTQDYSNIAHLQILVSTVYAFQHEEKRVLKSEK